MSQTNSPFKFLDSYEQSDADVFFGREKETQELYDALSGVKLLMVYGPSGAGKTSLIECGLRNQFSDADWFAITIHRGADINASVFASINEALDEKINLDPITKMPADPQIEFGQAIEDLFAERYQPVYLLFDQFEELLISGDEKEKIKFFTLLNKLVSNKVPSRILLIMREEFIGHLSEFEALCPSIFQHRFRVEKMGRKNVEEVIYDILEAPKYKAYFKVENSRNLAESILSKLPDKRKEIELAHVQVFLGELWDRAQSANKNGTIPVLGSGLIKKNDNLEGILESFLKKQITGLEGNYGKRVPLEVLAAMISERFTKLQLSETAIQADLKQKKVNSKKPISKLLTELEQRRIIRTIKVGDENQYEISHDVLALVVGQNLTEEMKMREKAGDIYKVYMDRQGLFTQDDINYLQPYEKFLSYPDLLDQKLKRSLENIQEQQKIQREKLIQEQNAIAIKKQLHKTKIYLTFTIVALFLAGYFFWLANDRQKEIQNYSEKLNSAFMQSKISLKSAYSLQKTAENNLTDLNKYIKLDLESLQPGDSLIKKTIIDRLNIYLPSNPDQPIAEPNIGEINTLNVDYSDAILILGYSYKIAKLKKLMPKAPEERLKQFITAFNRSLDAMEINTPQRFAAFMALVAYESKELTYLETVYDYNKIFKDNGELFQSPDSKRMNDGNLQKLLNKIKANQNGNGDENSGDGWKYRGRGIFQIEGRDRYKYYERESGYDLIKNPDILATIEIATPIACIIWTKKLGFNKYADKREFDEIVSINKEMDGKDDENYKTEIENYYKKACKLFDAN